MKHRLLIILFFPILSIVGQTKPDRKDTIIDFWHHKIYDRLYGYENRVVKDGNKILYAKISFKGKKEADLEYFRINDTLFSSIEYYENGNEKSTGHFILSNKIAAQPDTVTYEDPTNPGDFTQTLIYFNEIIKTGKWRESDNYCCLDSYGDYWEGEYRNGKKTGIWKHFISSFSNIEIERIDYDKDASKAIYINNIGQTLALDTLGKILQGRWIISSCESSTTSRMLLSKCLLYDGKYGGDCNNSYSRTNYYDFIDKTNFKRQRGDGCNKFKESSTTAKWKIIRENTGTFIIINFTDTKETWKFKLIYLDKKGILVTDRQ